MESFIKLGPLIRKALSKACADTYILLITTVCSCNSMFLGTIAKSEAKYESNYDLNNPTSCLSRVSTFTRPDKLGCFEFSEDSGRSKVWAPHRESQIFRVRGLPLYF